ncbi:hypothetical protein [Streptomyces syringium]|uniref:hypothetical protein n=1 Tax=Streptomyces syringium TaxID=76729 RepID=UPI00342C0DA7
MTDKEAEGDPARGRRERIDPKRANVVRHFKHEVAMAIQRGSKPCGNCNGIGKIIMVVEGQPRSYPCTCGG